MGVCVCVEELMPSTLMLEPARVGQDGKTLQVGTRPEQGARLRPRGCPRGDAAPAPGGFSPPPPQKPEGGAGGTQGTRTLLRGASSCPRRNRELGDTQRGHGQGERRCRWLSRRNVPAPPLLVTPKNLHKICWSLVSF